MCEYQRFQEGNLLICEYTNELCTLCVLGNSETFKRAEADEALHLESEVDMLANLNDRM